MAIENVPFIWGVAFVVDLVIGGMTFLLVIRKNVTPWLKGTMTWVGWWSFASALSLIVSMTNGPMATFSYHQIGVLTETMTNIGLVFWCVAYAAYNWYVTQDDWTEIDRLRAIISYKNRMKELDRESK